MQWIISTAVMGIYSLVATLAWIDERNKSGVDFRVELLAPEGGSYKIRNHGNRTLYNVQLDAEHLAAHRIEMPIYGFRLVPKEPQEFEISRDMHMRLPDGVKIRYKHHLLGKDRVQYVQLPPPKLEWNGAEGRWEPLPEI